MVSLEKLVKIHDRFCNEARAIISKKGADYNRSKQLEGDTLFNMKVSKLLGITDTTTQGVLTRLGDKFMRLISLTKDPNAEAAVKDEKVEDTIKDAINYLVYLYVLWSEEREENGSKIRKD